MSTIIGQDRSPFRGAAYQYIREADRLPSTDAAYAENDPILHVKLFCPQATWYIAGFDPQTGLAYGVTDLFEIEVGDFDMNEIKALRPKPFGLPVERDLHWKPRPMSEVLTEVRK
jgi:hypothetical protein